MIYTFPIYVPGIPAFIAVIAAISGIYLIIRKKTFIITAIPVSIAVMTGVFAAPMLALDRVILDDEKLEQTTGFWFFPTVKGFRLADLSSILIGTRTDLKGWSAGTCLGVAS
ncbi:MAG TPA: hypothetical protein DCZ94_00680 [Lentisphaeria bacterium]|nr:MAG: hypothetical protein A2X48_12245 [Lentisphaerae bacterium GWF2_49_21]HBC85446.1 hypothetical protein [Lentisphaeria bacterium]